MTRIIREGSFYGLATFYRRFIKGFNIVMAPIMNSLKKGEYASSNDAAKAFVEIKTRMAVSQLCVFLICFKIFEVACNTYVIGICEVLAQEGHLVAYFSEKLNDAKKKYSTYDKEFYVLIHALCYWQHYLLPQEFTFISDH